MEVIQEGARVSTVSATSSAQAGAKGYAAPSQAGGEFLIFRLAAEEYGIDILRVQEIRSYEAPTRISGAPDFIKGVINLRGVLVSILDLRLKFAQESVKYNDLTVVIVVNVGERVVGMVVDSVSDVLALANAQIRAVPEFDASVDTGFITGIGSTTSDDQGRMLILVDIERLISSANSGLPELSLN